MSLSLNKIVNWLMISAILLSIAIGGGLALWQGTKAPVNLAKILGRHPHLDYNFPLLSESELTGTGLTKKTGVEIEPFLQNQAKKIKPEDLSLRKLVLGLIVVTTTDRYCLSNGTVMSEGQGSGRFIVDTITEEGVWYKSAADRFFLQVGEYVHIDYNGKVHLENNTEPVNRQIDSNNDNI